MTSANETGVTTDRRLAYALLRATIGVNLAVHGISRLLAGPHAFAASLVGMFHATPLPAWSVMSFGLALPWVEAALGLMILLGLATRFALIAASLTILALTFGSTLRQDWQSAGLQLIYAAIYAALLAFRSENAYSLDRIRRCPATGNPCTRAPPRGILLAAQKGLNAMPHPPFTDVPGAIAEIQAGRMVVVVDDEDRENEGDLTLAAEFVTPAAINFMARYGRGLICLALTEDRADYLRLPPMAQENTSRFGTAFTESIEAREGVTTGISAADRARTISVAIDPTSTASHLARPGHVFPLRARKGGVLVRAGQTEASVDLARMAGLIPAGVICEIMNDDGTMARVPDLDRFCATHGLKMLTVAEMIRYRLRHERYIHRVAESPVHTRYGDFTMIAYESEVNGGESHLALVRGPVGEDGGDTPTLVRVHSHCLAGDVFGATTCDCRDLLERSLERIAEAGRGALIYLHNNSPGFELDRREAPARILLHRETRAREIHPDPAHEERHQRVLRQVGIGGQILADLNIRKIRLLSNTPTHVPALEGFDLEIVEQVPILDGAEVVPPRTR